MDNLDYLSNWKRIFSFLVDSIVAIILTIILFFPCSAVCSKMDFYKAAFDNYYNEYDKTQLFVKSGNNYIKYTEDENTYTYDFYAKTLEFYYFNYSANNNDKTYDNYWFNVHVLGLEDVLNRYENESNITVSYFEYIGNDYNAIGRIKNSSLDITTYDDTLPVVQKNVINNYFIEQYEKAITDFQNSSMLNGELYRKVALVQLVSPSISFIISYLILCIIVPLFLDGRTLGKLIFKGAVVNQNDYRLSKCRIIVRQLVLLLEIVGSLFTVGGIMLISYMMLLFNKNKKTIHDFIASSVVVNSDNSIWYEDKESMLEAFKKDEVISNEK